MKNQLGFTLIEVLVYLALLGLIFSGLFISAYAIIENIGRNDTQIMVNEEGGFLLAKIGFAINGATSVEVENDLILKINNPPTAIFRENGGYLEINGIPLNNSSVQVKNLEFIDNGNSGLEAIFTLQAKTKNGQIYLQDFSEKYFIVQ